MGVYLPPGFGLASMKFSCVGISDIMVVTFGYAAQMESGDFDTPDAHAQDIRVNLAATGKLLHPSFMSSQYTFLGVDVVEEHGNGHRIGTSPSADLGSFSAQPVPANCAVLVKKNTSRGGRQGRGRMYFPPFMMAETDVAASGQVAGGTLTAFQTRLTAFLTDQAADDMPMVLLHESPSLLPDTVNSLVAQSLLATQRRRMR